MWLARNKDKTFVLFNDEPIRLQDYQGYTLYEGECWVNICDEKVEVDLNDQDFNQHFLTLNYGLQVSNDFIQIIDDSTNQSFALVDITWYDKPIEIDKH